MSRQITWIFPTLTILEDYLNSFSGIVITVSHDRYFLDNIVDRIFEFDSSGSLCQYEGGYTDYLAAKERKAQEAGKQGKDTQNWRRWLTAHLQRQKIVKAGRRAAQRS